MKAYTALVLISSVAFATADLPSVCPRIVSKNGWGARTPIQVEYSIVPIEYVVVHHTVTPQCLNELDCSNKVRNIQDFHMGDLEFHDIGYNFLIGGDGNVYEGAGWHKVGAHTRGYNTRSIGIAFIGNFNELTPSAKQLRAGKALLECGVELGELDNRYKLFGARQVSSTQSPGLLLYRELQKWPHYVSNV